MSGYEENPEEETSTGNQDQSDAYEYSTTAGDTSTSQDETIVTATYETPSTPGEHLDRPAGAATGADDLDLSSLAISSHSTPRIQSQSGHSVRKPGTLKMGGNDDDDDDDIKPPRPSMTYAPGHSERQQDASWLPPTSTGLPSTPGKEPSSKSRHYLDPDLTETPPTKGKAAAVPSPMMTTTARKAHNNAAHQHHQKPTDPVMHRVLDKTYRVQATPHGKGKSHFSRPKYAVTPKNQPASQKHPPFYDDSPLSSPEPEAPKLRFDLFSSMKTPAATRTTPATERRRPQLAGSGVVSTPKPGISVFTPAKGGKGRQFPWGREGGLDDNDDDDDDDDDDVLGISPPKTMQFHVPQSRLMKTPGKSYSFFFNV